MSSVRWAAVPEATFLAMAEESLTALSALGWHELHAALQAVQT